MTDHARPLIGITAMHSGASADGRELQAVRPTYLRAIEAAGGIPLIIYLTNDLSAVRARCMTCAPASSCPVVMMSIPPITAKRRTRSLARSIRNAMRLR